MVVVVVVVVVPILVSSQSTSQALPFLTVEVQHELSVHLPGMYHLSLPAVQILLVPRESVYQDFSSSSSVM